MATPFSNSQSKSNNVSVVLERDPAVEEALLSLSTKTDLSQKSQCFICGGNNVPYPEGQARGRYNEETKLLKRLLKTSNVRKKMSPKVYNQFSQNPASCADCLEIIREVWSLNQEMNQLVEKAMESVISRCGGLNKSMNKNKRIKLSKDPPASENVGVDPNVVDQPLNQNNHVAVLKANVKNVRVKSESDSEGDSDDQESGVAKSDTQESIGKKRRYKKSLSKKWTQVSRVKLEADAKNSVDTSDSDSSSSDESSSTSDHEHEESESDEVEERHSECQKKTNSLMDRKARKGYQCSKCGKMFSRFDHLAHHEILVCKIQHDKKELHQLNITIHKCNHCNAQFYSRTDLQRHIGVHSASGKSFKCPGCPTYFKLKSNMVMHCRKYRTDDGKCSRHLI